MKKYVIIVVAVFLILMLLRVLGQDSARGAEIWQWNPTAPHHDAVVEIRCDPASAERDTTPGRCPNCGDIHGPQGGSRAEPQSMGPLPNGGSYNGNGNGSRYRIQPRGDIRGLPNMFGPSKCGPGG